MNQTLLNERAFLMAREMLRVVQNCLRPEEQRDAFEEFFATCKRNLESLQVQAATMTNRLNPSIN